MSDWEKSAPSANRAVTKEIHGKGCACPQLTVNLDGPAVRFRNCLCQRQPQPDSLGILGKTAPVKPFENMGQVFRMDTFAIVSYDNLDNGGKFTPFNPDFGPFVRMVKGIFNAIIILALY